VIFYKIVIVGAPSRPVWRYDAKEGALVGAYLRCCMFMEVDAGHGGPKDRLRGDLQVS